MHISTIERRISTAIILMLAIVCAEARPAGDYVSARDLFNQAYNDAFGPKGSSFSYAVNIIGLYKTRGNVWMKGKKQYFVESRYMGWNNGRELYKLDKKKREVEIHNANSPKRDKYSSKFTFSPDDFTYTAGTNKQHIIITLTAKPGTKGNIKHAKIYLNRTTRHPESLRIKVLFFWTTIKISNFKSGGIDDDIFVFPQNRYHSYKIKDLRPN